MVVFALAAFELLFFLHELGKVGVLPRWHAVSCLPLHCDAGLAEVALFPFRWCLMNFFDAEEAFLVVLLRHVPLIAEINTISWGSVKTIDA